MTRNQDGDGECRLLFVSVKVLNPAPVRGQGMRYAICDVISGGWWPVASSSFNLQQLVFMFMYLDLDYLLSSKYK